MIPTVQERQIEELEGFLSEIRKDVEEASALAAGVSEKFNSISQSVQGFSTVFTKAFKDERAGQAVKVAGYAIKLLGGAYASIKEEWELTKLLPKKQELAAAKKDIILQHRQNLESRLPRFEKLLAGEASRDYSNSSRSAFIGNHAKDCCSAFEMYALSLYLYDVCSFMIREFEAWEKERHDCGSPMPLQHQTLLKIANEVLAPEGLPALAKKGKKTGAMYLFSQYDGLLGALFLKVKQDAKLPKGEEEKEHIYDQIQYRRLNQFYSDVKKINNDKEDELSWVNKNTIFQEFKKNLNLNPLFLGYFKYIYVGCTILFLLITQNLQAGLIISLIVTTLLILFNNVIQELKKQRFSFQSTPTYERVFSMIMIIGSLGTSIYAKNRYKKKEESYKLFINNIGHNIFIKSN